MRASVRNPRYPQSGIRGESQQKKKKVDGGYFFAGCLHMWLQRNVNGSRVRNIQSPNPNTSYTGKLNMTHSYVFCITTFPLLSFFFLFPLMSFQRIPLDPQTLFSNAGPCVAEVIFSAFRNSTSLGAVGWPVSRSTLMTTAVVACAVTFFVRTRTGVPQRKCLFIAPLNCW